MTTMNHSITSFMLMPAPNPSDNEWISQLNLKRFEPIGSKANRRLTKVFEKCFPYIRQSQVTLIMGFWRKDCNKLINLYKKSMSLERFDNATFARILSAFVSVPKFREEYNIPIKFAQRIRHIIRFSERFDDVRRI